MFRFSGDSTQILPKGHLHQIFNTNAQATEITGVFAVTPVAAYLPDASALALSWRT